MTQLKQQQWTELITSWKLNSLTLESTNLTGLWSDWNLSNINIVSVWRESPYNNCGRKCLTDLCTVCLDTSALPFWLKKKRANVNLACKPESQIVGRELPTQQPYMDKDYREIRRWEWFKISALLKSHVIQKLGCFWTHQINWSHAKQVKACA